MVHGALTQKVTGLLLVGLPEMGVATPYTGWEAWDHTKIAIKLILTVIITILAFVGRRKPLGLGLLLLLHHLRRLLVLDDEPSVPIHSGERMGKASKL